MSEQSDSWDWQYPDKNRHEEILKVFSKSAMPKPQCLKRRRIYTTPIDRPEVKLICDLMPTYFKAKATQNGQNMTVPTIFANEVKLEKITFSKHRGPYCVMEEHNYAVSKENVQNLQDTVARAGAMYEDLQEELKTLKRMVCSRAKMISNLTIKPVVGTTTIQPQNARCTWRHFVKNPKAFEAYTGFTDQRKFQRFMDTIQPICSIAVQLPNYNISLPLTDQIFLTLMRFKLGFNHKDLMDEFCIAGATMERIWEFWLELLDQQLARLELWPQTPRRVILDSAQMRVSCKGVEHSAESHEESARGLLGVTPDGLIVFVSDLYLGNLSEIEITRKCGIFAMLGPGDEVIADDAFSVEFFLKRGIRLRRPVDARPERGAAERIIREMRRYKILKMTHPHNRSSKIFKICCSLMNFNRDDFLSRIL